MARRINEIISQGRVSFSMEVTPDITEDELENLNLEPAFFSITWHAQVHECKNFEIAPLNLAKHFTDKGKNVLLHISCCYMKKDYLNDLLELLKNMGICNLFIILGENFNRQYSDFESSKDMIIHIRQRTGNYFCIGVAGFPAREKKYYTQLKDKVMCGVDFILTQAFFEFTTYDQFIRNCKEADIGVPIMPGIFPFETLNELSGFVKLCKVHINEDEIIQKLSKVSGIEMITELLNEMIQKHQINHLHFFTLNKIQRTSKLIRNIPGIM